MNPTWCLLHPRARTGTLGLVLPQSGGLGYVVSAAARSSNLRFCITHMNGDQQQSRRNKGLISCLWFLLEEESMSFSMLLLEKGSSKLRQTQHRLKILKLFFQGPGEQKDFSVPGRGGECLYQPNLCLWPGTMTVYLTYQTKVPIISSENFLLFPWVPLGTLLEFTEFCASTHGYR